MNDYNGSLVLRFRTSEPEFLRTFFFFLSFLDRKEKLELRGKLLLGIQAVREVDAPNAAVRMDLHAKRFNVVGACKSRKFVEISFTVDHWQRVVIVGSASGWDIHTVVQFRG